MGQKEESTPAIGGKIKLGNTTVVGFYRRGGKKDTTQQSGKKMPLKYSGGKPWGRLKNTPREKSMLEG